MIGMLFYGRPNVSETFPAVTELTPAIFRCLREGVYSGIVLSDFATEEEVAAGIRAGRQLSAGSGEWPGPSVGSASNPEKLEYYLSEAQATVDKTRRIFGGCTPIDRLFGLWGIPPRLLTRPMMSIQLALRAANHEQSWPSIAIGNQLFQLFG